MFWLGGKDNGVFILPKKKVFFYFVAFKGQFYILVHLKVNFMNHFRRLRAERLLVKFGNLYKSDLYKFLFIF